MITLKLHLDNYTKLRRQLGFKLRMAEVLLGNFVRFADREKAKFITTKLALRWATRPANIKAVQRANRLGMLRRFAEHVSALDPRTEIPPQKLLPYQYRRQAPYCYRETEVVQLIDSARRIGAPDELKGATYATLFGLLAATGMRVGEAIALNREDIDIEEALITVHRAKGNKSRWVPLHPSVQQALKDYAGLRDRTLPNPPSSNLFVSETGTRLLHCTVNRWFLIVSRGLGFRGAKDRQGPRLHDLRHYFAIRTLLNWYRLDVDVEAQLPRLATYLGHVHVRDTYWYLSAVPELLQLATLRWQRTENRQ